MRLSECQVSTGVLHFDWRRLQKASSKKSAKLGQELAVEFYNDRVLTSFPSLVDEHIAATEVRLPSNRKKRPETEDERRWYRVEVVLRVGLCHEILNDIRIAAGLHSYYNRKKGGARGKAQMDSVSRSQKAASTRKANHVKKYCNNWRRLTKVLEMDRDLKRQETQLLKGLQPLNKEEDVVFFEEWGTKAESYMGHLHLNISWIWKVAMQANESIVLNVPDQINDATRVWESEGTYPL